MRFAVARMHICVGAVVALVSFSIQVHAKQKPASPPQAVGPHHGIGEDRVFSELVGRNLVRADTLLEYSADRTYQVSHPDGKMQAKLEGRMEFHAPDTKVFQVTSEQGSGIVCRLALQPLIAIEIRAAARKDRHDSAITPANYRLQWVGEESVGTYRCYVLRATPKRVDKYLFDGKIWVDEDDFAVVRIEGRPAARLSFWIKRADFVRQYQMIAGFWLPQRDETAVEVRFYGKRVLTIEHYDYRVKRRPVTDAAGAQ